MASEEQRQQLMRAADAMEDAIAKGLEFIAANINWKLSEADLAQFMQGRLALRRIPINPPHVAFNRNSVSSAYSPLPDTAAIIRRSGWLAVALSSPPPQAIAISRIAVLGNAPTPAQTKLFSTLAAARDAALAALQKGERRAAELHRIMAERLQAAPAALGTIGGQPISAESNAVLEEGATVALEPTASTPEFGAILAATAHLDPAGQLAIVAQPQAALDLMET